MTDAHEKSELLRAMDQTLARSGVNYQTNVRSATLVYRMNHALRFARRYPKWHTFNPERETRQAINELAAQGLVETNEHGQFRAVEVNVAPKTRTSGLLDVIIASGPLLDAVDACMPDLDHYSQTHGPGPDRRLGTLQTALRMVRHTTTVEDIKSLLAELPQLELSDALMESGYVEDPRDE